jgi:hypothetical protein
MSQRPHILITMMNDARQAHEHQTPDKVHDGPHQTPDKVHDGPCAAQFAALEKCAKTKDPRRFKVHIKECKRETLAGVSFSAVRAQGDSHMHLSSLTISS